MIRPRPAAAADVCDRKSRIKGMTRRGVRANYSPGEMGPPCNFVVASGTALRVAPFPAVLNSVSRQRTTRASAFTASPGTIKPTYLPPARLRPRRALLFCPTSRLRLSSAHPRASQQLAQNTKHPHSFDCICEDTRQPRRAVDSSGIPLSRGYQKWGRGAPHLSLDEAPSMCNEPDLNL
jgi:hypothetical protein